MFCKKFYLMSVFFSIINILFANFSFAGQKVDNGGDYESLISNHIAEHLEDTYEKNFYLEDFCESARDGLKKLHHLINLNFNIGINENVNIKAEKTISQICTQNSPYFSINFHLYDDLDKINLTAANSSEAQHIYLNPLRWNAIHKIFGTLDNIIWENIATHEILSLIGVEATGNYSASKFILKYDSLVAKYNITKLTNELNIEINTTDLDDINYLISFFDILKTIRLKNAIENKYSPKLTNLYWETKFTIIRRADELGEIVQNKTPEKSNTLGTNTLLDDVTIRIANPKSIYLADHYENTYYVEIESKNLLTRLLSLAGVNSFAELNEFNTPANIELSFNKFSKNPWFRITIPKSLYKHITYLSKRNQNMSYDERNDNYSFILNENFELIDIFTKNCDTTMKLIYENFKN